MRVRPRQVPVTDSKLAMWRAAIALAYADHRLTNSEQNLLHEYMEAFNFSEAQQRQLEQDLRNGVALDEVFNLITHVHDRVHLINFARVLFHIDGDFSQVEQELLELIESRHIATIDLRKALKEASTVGEKYEIAYAHYMAEEKEKEGPLLRAFGYFTRIWDDD